MKRIGKILLLSLIFMLFITGCKKETKEVVEKKKETIATKLVDVFEKEIKKENDIEEVANIISTNKNMEIAVGVMDVEEGALDGFDGKIKGFEKAYAIKPMISSQPFIAYIFETKNPDVLKETLNKKANKRWNVCTEADELEISVIDNYVFVIMSPTTFDE